MQAAVGKLLFTRQATHKVPYWIATLLLVLTRAYSVIQPASMPMST